VGERQLERVFREQVGVTPKGYARLARFQASLALARGGARWAEVAARAGFADQSHLVREYRALSGASPSLLASEWRMSGLSKTGPEALATVRSQGSSREGSRERSSLDDRDRDRDRDRDPAHHGG
jgi:AraC-like DNA-binding protein